MNPSGQLPKLLKATYLADAEGLLRETRSTALYYFPGPVLAILVTLFLDYSAAAYRSASLPTVPGLQSIYDHLPAISGTGPGSYLLSFFLILTMLSVLLLLIRYLQWISTVYAVTSTRVIIQKGIFSRDFDEIPVTQVRGVDVHQTFVQRVLRYGTIQVSSEGGHSLGNESWHGIPKPFDFQRVIESASQSLLRGTWAGNPPAPPAPGPYLRPPGRT
ncbi:MAG: PH domain-containing protein [Thermoplasmata archaeon]|nr:PH domain-containing protein [Thermoplasmata archaeon]